MCDVLSPPFWFWSSTCYAVTDMQMDKLETSSPGGLLLCRGRINYAVIVANHLQPLHPSRSLSRVSSCVVHALAPGDGTFGVLYIPVSPLAWIDNPRSGRCFILEPTLGTCTDRGRRARIRVRFTSLDPLIGFREQTIHLEHANLIVLFKEPKEKHKTPISPRPIHCTHCPMPLRK